MTSVQTGTFSHHCHSVQKGIETKTILLFLHRFPQIRSKASPMAEILVLNTAATTMKIKLSVAVVLPTNKPFPLFLFLYFQVSNVKKKTKNGDNRIFSPYKIGSLPALIYLTLTDPQGAKCLPAPHRETGNNVVLFGMKSNTGHRMNTYF